MLGARLTPGIDVVLEAIGFDESLAGADLVLTGEGSLDAQSVSGKAVAGVSERAKRAGVACVALGGRIAGDLGPLRCLGLTGAFPLCTAPMSEREAMERTSELLALAGEQVVRVWMAAR